MNEANNRLREGYYEHQEVRCAECGARIDLDDAEDIDEAAEIWNDHVADEHPEFSEKQ